MVTLTKIAKLSHVSLSTASKAFSMSNEVNEQTRNIIFDVAKKEGCFKKFFNAKYPKYVVAVICPEFRGRNYSEQVSFLQSCLNELNCEVCVTSSDFSSDTIENLIEYYTMYMNVDAVVLMGGNIKQQNDIEAVVVNVNSNNDNCADININGDLKNSISDSIDYFISKNIFDIGFISEEHTEVKKQFFEELMRKKVGEDEKIMISVSNERFEKGGYSAMEKFFLSGKVPRAVICAYDYMAIGAVKCIFDKGLKVPDDIAVIGMDNIPEARFLVPSLSSIGYQYEIAYKAAMNELVNKLNGKTYEKNIPIKSVLFLRESTKIIL